jgi:DNA (cytosine-5)-methyltransferase 1
VYLLPTPKASDATGGKHSEGHADSLPGTVRLLPTPRKSDGDGGANPLSREERMDDVETRIIRLGGVWGEYEPAVRRWEALTRPAPPPTEPNTKGNPRLNPAFSEWLMGWPEGWVTDIPGVSRNDQLRIIGNGVVPQCAAAALRWLLSLEVAA